MTHRARRRVDQNDRRARPARSHRAVAAPSAARARAAAPAARRREVPDARPPRSARDRGSPDSPSTWRYRRTRRRRSRRTARAARSRARETRSSVADVYDGAARPQLEIRGAPAPASGDRQRDHREAMEGRRKRLRPVRRHVGRDDEQHAQVEREHRRHRRRRGGRSESDRTCRRECRCGERFAAHAIRQPTAARPSADARSLRAARGRRRR